MLMQEASHSGKCRSHGWRYAGYRLERRENVLLTAEGRIFGLDMQLLSGMVFQMIAIFVLFIALTCILYEPVRKVLNARKERIANEVEEARQSRKEADDYRTEYEAKLKEVQGEAELILREAHRKALDQKKVILTAARKEEENMIRHARKEAELEWSKMRDEVKQNMIRAATLMAGKIVKVSLDEKTQLSLIQETLKEMDEETWLGK